MITTVTKEEIITAYRVMNMVSYALNLECNRRIRTGQADWKEVDECAKAFILVGEMLIPMMFGRVLKGEER